MKLSSFMVGLVAGATAVVFSKKVLKNKFCGDFCHDSSKESPALKETEDAVNTLRGSVDSLRKELNCRIESEQTYASKVEELSDQVAKKDIEIENLKNICEKQDGQYKKLEEELSQAKANQ